MAGSLPSRRCGSAARMSRSVDCSVPAMARAHSSSPSASNVPGGRTAGVDHQQVQAAELVDGRRDRSRGAVGRGEVGHDRAHRWPRLGPPASRRCGRRARRARPPPPARGDAGTDAGAATAHERSLATEPQVHRGLLIVVHSPIGSGYRHRVGPSTDFLQRPLQQIRAGQSPLEPERVGQVVRFATSASEPTPASLLSRSQDATGVVGGHRQARSTKRRAGPTSHG